MTNDTPDPRPSMSEAELNDFLNLMSDKELADPARIAARLERTHRVSSWHIGVQAERMLTGRLVMREAVEIAVSLAELTGEGWQASRETDDPPSMVILSANQYRVRLNFNHHENKNGRILVSPSYDKDHRGNRHNLSSDEHETITVSRSRKPAAIAADINRRILTWYRPAQDRNREAIKRENSKLDAIEARVSLLIEIAGPDAEVKHPLHGRWGTSRKKGDPVLTEIGENGSPKVTAELNDNGMMTLKIKGVSLETGLELLQMLKTIRQAEALAQAERMKKAEF
jgi:hypothetical protein